MSELNQMGMPPGWDTKYDSKTGKSYFFNHITKNASLDDPRIRFKQLQCEDIPLHPLQKPAQSAFTRGPPFYQINQDYCNSSGHPSPLPSYRSFGHSPAHSQRSYSPVQSTLGSSSVYRDYSISTYNIDDSILKISLLFPTVEESHIRALLMKYHNREAVVISALQVEKHPICTPGPYTPPPRGRRFMTSSTVASSPSSSPRPNIWRSLSSSSPPKPPHSPKMKLRYLKSVFPVVEDTVLLDTLSGSDNNVVKATEALLTLGFTKKLNNVPSTPRITLSGEDELKKEEREKEEEARKLAALSRMKTLEEKNAMKSRLQARYPNIPDRIVSLALEVVDYRETMAAHILDVTTKNDGGGEKKSKDNSVRDEKDVGSAQPSLENAVPNVDAAEPPFHTTVTIPPPQRPCTLGSTNQGKEIRKSVVITVCSDKPGQHPGMVQGKRPKGKSATKISRGTCTAEDKNYKSSLVNSPQGPNPELPVGPQEQHILPDYVPWTGPNESLLFGAKIKPKGPNKLLLSLKTIFARGPNKSLVKGPCKGLAKGSIYSQQHETTCH
ncbi:hypothetical protein M8J77_002813 [Diaphorina citri]|nr:hypothetical protein M8J77_002813 [Diaphorina citri]